MSYEQLLTNKCDIYKKSTITKQGAYGAPGSKRTTFPENATYVNVPCLMLKASNSVQIQEPGVEVDQKFMMHFLKDADVNLGDKVVWNNVTFILSMPLNVRNHHIEVEAVREREQN